MKLNPGERSVLARFFRRAEAEAARDHLIASGFEHVQLDRVGRFGFAPEPDTRRPGSGGSSLASSVLYDHEGHLDDESRVLLAAMTSVSGMSGEVDYQPPFLLTVVTWEGRVEEVRSIVQSYGGEA